MWTRDAAPPIISAWRRRGLRDSDGGGAGDISASGTNGEDLWGGGARRGSRCHRRRDLVRLSAIWNACLAETKRG
ncbi:unnamed protein product [Lampetra planeri]